MVPLLWAPSTEARKSSCTHYPATGSRAARACIWHAAKQYNQSYREGLRVASCESGLNNYAYFGHSSNRQPATWIVYKGNISAGLFEFKPSTWEGTPYGHKSIWSAMWNAKAAMWMWSVGRKGEWVC